MITPGQARRLIRVYGCTSFLSAPSEIREQADTCRDPQGAYADARAMSDYVQGHPLTSLLNVPEDMTVVPWGYKRIFMISLDLMDRV